MADEKPVESTKPGSEVVCPESTIQSANDRVPVRNASLLGTKKAGKTCESTVESSLRRDFIRKAAMTTAAVGIGATLLGKSVLPSSSASSNSTNFCFEKPAFFSDGDVFVNFRNNNNRGSVNFGTCRVVCNCSCHGWFPSGTSITSGRFQPMDFYVNGGPDLRIGTSYYGHDGVGINTCCPNSALDVNGNINSSSGITSKGNVCVSGGLINGNCGVVGKSSSGFGICGTSCSSYGINGRSSTSFGVAGLSNSSHGVDGRSVTSAGVFGYSCCGPGIVVINAGATAPGICVQAQNSGIGIVAQSNNPLIGKFKNFGSSTDKTALIQFESADSTPVDWNAGVAGFNNACKVPDGSFYLGQAGKPRLVVNSGGNLGIGTTKPQTTLQVKGGMSLQLKTETANYTMGPSDFAVIANPPGTGMAVTLPPAKNVGMVVYVKNISINSVSVKGAGTDLIEGSSTIPLPNKYSSVYLIAGGGSPGEWYILSTAT